MWISHFAHNRFIYTHTHTHIIRLYYAIVYMWPEAKIFFDIMMLAFLRMRSALIFAVHILLLLFCLHSPVPIFSVCIASLFIHTACTACSTLYLNVNLARSMNIHCGINHCSHLLFFWFSGFNITITINYAMLNDLHDLTAFYWFIGSSST